MDPMKHTILAAAALILGFAVEPASALPLIPGDAVLTHSALDTVQFRRGMRDRRQVCRVETIRRRTPRGVVVTKVRRCR